MGCWFNCHRTTHQAPSTTHHYEHIKQEIIHKAEGEFGINAKVDVDVLVDFMLQVQIDMGLDIGIQISVFKNEVFGIIGLIAFCVAIVLIAYFLRKCGCCCVTTSTTTNTNILNQDARDIEADSVMPRARFSARNTLRKIFKRDLEDSIERKKQMKGRDSRMDEPNIVLINNEGSYGQEVVTAGYNWDKIFFWRKSEENGDLNKKRQNDIASMYEMK